MTSTLDPAEVDRFRHIASEWWDKNGKFKPLHQQTPARLSFIRDILLDHYGGDPQKLKPLTKIRLLDIGCGGGLISEPMARMGAMVLGIDPGAENIASAQAHAEQYDALDLTYRKATIEDISSEGELYDCILCLEVLEHVPDPRHFLKLCSGLLRPQGVLILSTINRNLKSFALAIVAAEYLLRWLPRGTHTWERFITPDELRQYFQEAGLSEPKFKGLEYDLFNASWKVSEDIDVNYFAVVTKSFL